MWNVCMQDIAIAVKQQLEEVMKEYGYQILQALVTDMDPDRRVKEAMNEINASKRLREAATNKAEADKIMQVRSFYPSCLLYGMKYGKRGITRRIWCIG